MTSEPAPRIVTPGTAARANATAAAATAAAPREPLGARVGRWREWIGSLAGRVTLIVLLGLDRKSTRLNSSHRL